VKQVQPCMVDNLALCARGAAKVKGGVSKLFCGWEMWMWQIGCLGFIYLLAIFNHLKSRGYFMYHQD